MLHEIMPPVIWRFGKRVLDIQPTNGFELSKGEQRGADYYDKFYAASEEYLKHYTHSRYYFLWCVIADRMKPQPSDFVLDVGCGPGQFAAFLLDQGLGRYVGMDFSGETIRMARKACPSATFQKADVFHTDLFETTPYNTVLCTEFLEHIEEDLQVLERVRPGTRVYGTVPNFSDPGHVRYFKTTADVTHRYSHLFRSWKCDAFHAGPQGPTYFLFEGNMG
jgi:2-polyprenyl-3-methyl-5-hydroxy-6-metoxy-1,4-benzoquinol methylase